MDVSSVSVFTRISSVGGSNEYIVIMRLWTTGIFQERLVVTLGNWLKCLWKVWWVGVGWNYRLSYWVRKYCTIIPTCIVETKVKIVPPKDLESNCLFLIFYLFHIWWWFSAFRSSVKIKFWKWRKFSSLTRVLKKCLSHKWSKTTTNPTIWRPNMDHFRRVSSVTDLGWR